MYSTGANITAQVKQQDHKVRAIDSLLDLGRNIFPENLVQACLYQMTTEVKEVEVNLRKHYVANLSSVLKANHTLYSTMVNGTNTTFYLTSDWVSVAAGKSYGGNCLFACFLFQTIYVQKRDIT